MTTPHKHAEVLRAIADGKEVEYKYNGQWFRQTLGRNPIECQHLEWRIKPEPMPPIVVEQHAFLGGRTWFDVTKEPNIRFTFDPDTKLPIKVELI